MIDAMKQAVEAFEHIKKYVTDDGAMPENWDAYHEKEYFALEALRQAIEQAEKQTHTDHPMRHWDRTCPACVAEAEKQQPVAYKYVDKHNPLIFYFTTHKDSLPNPEVIETALYTAPPKREWVGLTDVEVGKYSDRLNGGDIAREVEVKLRERNT